ncbi:hypothetical protein [Sphingobacterium sp.]|nr:hypothetical protein [Sphingobacterium sp.]
MKKLLKKLQMFFGIGLNEEERAEVLQRAKEYAYKHTFQRKEE